MTMILKNIIPLPGEIYYYPSFFSKETSDRYFDHLLNETAWKQEPIVLFGKKIMQPRLTALYGDEDYTYSGITMRARGWNPTLLEIKSSLEKQTGAKFTRVLLNCYRDGKDSMGWHRDNEKELGDKPLIASVSFGGTRNFQIRRYADKSMKQQLALTHGSLLIMSGETQLYWEHQVPKTSQSVDARINATFRISR